jgi:hypothetical protein
MPELKGQRKVYDQVGRELFGYGLTDTDSFHGSMTGPGSITCRTTVAGKRFLRFISVPN